MYPVKTKIRLVFAIAATLALLLSSCALPDDKPSITIASTDISTTKPSISTSVTSQPSPTPATTTDGATVAVASAQTTTTAQVTPTSHPTATPTTTTTSAATAAVATTSSSSDFDHDVSRIHRAALVIDTHNDTMLRVVDGKTWLPVTNLSQKTPHMIDIPKMQAGGIDIATFAAYSTGYALSGGGQDFTKANSRLLALMNALHWTVQHNQATLQLISSYDDAIGVPGQGRIGVVASIEGAYSFYDDNAFELLRQYRDLGIRMLAPVWNNSNALGEGVNEKYRDGSRSNGGLSQLGRQVVADMNELGIIVDVSHMNESTFWDTMEVSSDPVIASHSSVYNLCRQARNLKDDQIKAIAAGGGVIQVNFHRPFLAEDESRATVATLVDHIDYIVRLVGIDYVGLGSDFDGARMPKGLEDASKYPAITRELLVRGYSEEAILKVLGGNSARLFDKVWGHSDYLSSALAPHIESEISMGSQISSNQPLLRAVLSSSPGQELDPESFQIIIDGIAYKPDYDATLSTISLQVTEPLKEKFHVVTFAATSLTGQKGRKTIIFHMEGPAE